MITVYSPYMSPIGLIYVVMNEIGVKRIIITAGLSREYILESENAKRDDIACKEAIEQIDEYFLGKRFNFTLPLYIEGTEFYKKVWERLLAIPYGQTRSYGEIAEEIGNPKACRAVGQANRNNPIPIIIPCHRVIGKNGQMIGYMGDKTDIKKQLLDMEKGKIKWHRV